MARRPPVSQTSELKAYEDHNILAYLNTEIENGRALAGGINFLRRSRIFYAISTPCTAYTELVQEFWTNAFYNSRDNRWLITSSVRGTPIKITPAVLRNVLQFTEEDEDSVYHLSVVKVKGIIKRCHYVFNVNGKTTVKTNGLPPLYRYLAYVLNLCLSPKQAGHDAMTDNIQGAFAALVLNANFSFSKMTFDHMADNITSERHAFLKYPRFVQMIINSQAPEISKEGLNEIIQAQMTEATLGKMLVYRKDTGGVLHKPVYKNLICALKDPSYKCPPSTKWRNEGSDSEQEDLGVAPISDSEEEVAGREVPVEARESAAGGTSSSTPRKMKGKRKKKDDDVEILDLEDFLKENRKKTFKKVQGTASGSGPTSTQPPTVQPQNPQQNQPTVSSPGITTTAGGAIIDVSEMQVDLRLMKENYLDMMKRQKKFEEETTNYLKILQSKLKEEASYRIAVANENMKLKKEVDELKVENEGMKGYAKLLMEKVKNVEKKNKQLLRLTTGEAGEASDDDEESDEQEGEGEEADDEATQSESEG